MSKLTLMTGILSAFVLSGLSTVGSADAQTYSYGPYGCPGMMAPMMGQGMMGQGMMGPGMMMGSGMMGSGMMGPGMMGPGMMGPGMMGPGMTGQSWGAQINLNLSVAEVKTNFERWLAGSGNPRIKVGNVKQSDSTTINVDIVTTDKEALVQRFAVDRTTGAYRQVQ